MRWQSAVVGGDEAWAVSAARLGAIHTVFQPVVALDDLTVVGFEALVRGDGRLGRESPEQLFAAAAAEGLTVEVDWACQAEALRSALQAQLPVYSALFVNVEPETVVKAFPPNLGQLANDAIASLQVVFEITERALGRYGKAVMAGVHRARELGALIAIDDLGAEEAALELIPVLQPDVIKLDKRLIQHPCPSDIDHLVAPAVAYAGDNGATIVAEGIETRQHHEQAIALGATCGQGWLHGRPAPLPPPDPGDGVPLGREQLRTPAG